MRQPIFKLAVIAGVTLANALMLSACGRKGPLEPPPSATIVDEDGKVREAPKTDRPFILDPLI